MHEELKISKGQSAIVTIAHDKQREEQGQYGTKFVYLVNHDGKEKIYKASETVHKKLQTYKKGDTVSLYLKPLDGGRSFWDIKAATLGPASNLQPVQTLKEELKAQPRPSFEDSRKDTEASIHVQVALKLAVEAIGQHDQEKHGNFSEYSSSVCALSVRLLDLIEGGLRHAYNEYKNLNVEQGSGE